MDKNDLMHLKIEEEANGCSIMLDDKKLHHVTDYEIEQTKPSGTAVVTLKIHVKYP
ncbi:MAG: hypothetical protein ACOCM4_13565 [Acetivibrio ethanolgignens]